jgi:hypothetical protein
MRAIIHIHRRTYIHFIKLYYPQTRALLHVSVMNRRPQEDVGTKDMKCRYISSASDRNEYQEYFLGDKGGQCVELTTILPSCVDCLEIWEPQPPVAVGTCPCLSKPVQACPCLSKPVPACPCLSMPVHACPCLSMPVPACPCLSKPVQGLLNT